MKLLLSLTLAFIGTVAYAQDFKMVDTTPPKEVEPEIKYDSLANLFPISNKDYYKPFIGQSILFFPRNPNAKSLPEYYVNFTTPHKQVVAIDTVWFYNKKKKSYRLDSTTTNRYKPQYTKEKKVTVCGLKAYYGNDFLIGSYKYNKEKPDALNKTGDFTPYNEIEGKSFKLIDFTFESGSAPSMFTLQSENNDTIYWTVEPEGYFSKKHTSKRYPIIVSGYIEKMKQLYLNKDIYILSTSSAKKYKCTEIVYSGDEDHYMVPSFVLKSDKEDLIMPLTEAPALFSNEMEYEDWEPLKDKLVLDRQSVMEATAYQAKLEKEAEAERQSKIEKQKRKTLLCKKYGQTYGTLISERKVQIGMTKAMCEEAWGKPESKNTSSGAWGVHEQWVFSYDRYLYFENGKLTSIQY